MLPLAEVAPEVPQGRAAKCYPSLLLQAATSVPCKSNLYFSNTELRAMWIFMLQKFISLEIQNTFLILKLNIAQATGNPPSKITKTDTTV